MKTRKQENKKTKQENNQNLEIMRHSTAHLLAAAVQELYPKTKFGVGPVVEAGFYYDLDVRDGQDKPLELKEKDLAVIEQKMRELQKKNLKFVRKEMGIAAAINFFKKMGQDYKVELLQDLKKKGTTKIQANKKAIKQENKELESKVDFKKGGKISVYTTGNFVDLCRGPHVGSTEEIKIFKLHRLSGAYWRGDEKNKMLTRIYGLAFFSEKDLDDYLKMLSEAEARDHRRLGQDLKIFTFSDLVGPGLPLWLPNGAILIEELERLAKEKEQELGYRRVRTPHIAKEILYRTSGHLPYYAESMFPPMVLEEDGQKTVYYLKAMNCPHHHQIYLAEPKSYRDLPLRLAEYGACYRYEKSGELFGLMRARSLEMNDAHIYCAEEQFEEEFINVIRLYLDYFKIFGIKKYVMRLSTHSRDGLGKKYIDNEKLWKKTEEMVRRAMKKSRVPYVEAEGEAAFYGPKIDVQIWSAIGREFTLATNQVDFAVPARFGLTYKDKDGKDQMPLCIHRAPLSTHERMIGFLIEHYAGAFPLWLSPAQAQIIPVGRDYLGEAKKLKQKLENAGIRANVDEADGTVGYKIRKAEKEKIPYMLVIGEKEKDLKLLSVRERGRKETLKMDLEEFIKKLREKIDKRC